MPKWERTTDTSIHRPTLTSLPSTTAHTLVYIYVSYSRTTYLLSMYLEVRLGRSCMTSSSEGTESIRSMVELEPPDVRTSVMRHGTLQDSFEP